MSDEQDIRGRLERMAAGDPLGPIDSARLLDRGRRGKRRRRVLASGGAVAAVTVIAVTAAMVPGLGSAKSGYDQAPVAVTPSKPTVKPTGGLTKKSWPSDPAIQVDPDADDVTVLRACSAKLKKIKADIGKPHGLPRGHEPITTDLTGWRIVARMNLTKIGTMFVALSPTGDKAAHCDLYAPNVPSNYGTSSTTGASRVVAPPQTLGEHHFEVGSGCDSDLECTGWLYVESGRVTKQVARFHLEATNGHTIDVPVHDGWYAIMWADGVRNFLRFAKWTAYDAAGKKVPIDPDFYKKLDR